MEMDRQTIMVVFAAIVGLTLFGGVYLSSPKQRDVTRPVYAEEDIRHKLQKEDLKKSKAKKKKTAAAPTILSSESSSSGDAPSDGESNDDEPQEEPALD